MDKTRSLSQSILKRYPDKFTSDYEQNKKALDEIALIPSKQMRNRIAGYISKSLKVEEEPEEPEAPKEKGDGPEEPKESEGTEG